MNDTKNENRGEIYVIFPCYNEEEGLEKLLQRFRRLEKIMGRKFRLVVVNDGSADHTVHVARSFADEVSMHLIDFPVNRGVAAVFNTAFDHVLRVSREGDVIVTIDSDNTMNPYVILDMVDRINTCDVVIASRFVKGGKMVGAGYRALMSHVASWLMRWRVGIPGVRDYSIFYRAYRREALRAVFEQFAGEPVAGAGFSCMANLLVRMVEGNPALRIREVPLTLRYDLKESGSAVRIPRTIWGYLKLAFGGGRGKR